MKSYFSLLISEIELLTRQLNRSMHVIPANAGIQIQTGCRIESGMTELWYLIAGLIIMVIMAKIMIQLLYQLSLHYNLLLEC